MNKGDEIPRQDSEWIRRLHTGTAILIERPGMVVEGQWHRGCFIVDEGGQQGRCDGRTDYPDSLGETTMSQTRKTRYDTEGQLKNMKFAPCNLLKRQRGSSRTFKFTPCSPNLIDFSVVYTP